MTKATKDGWTRIVLDLPAEAKEKFKKAATSQLTDMAHALRTMVHGYIKAHELTVQMSEPKIVVKRKGASINAGK